MNTTINTILIGDVKPITGTVHSSGIDKHPVSGAIRASKNGLLGDFQGDLKHHGGADKALHHYAFEHYGFWRDELGDKDVLRKPGAFGENLSSTGLTEEHVCIGDVFSIGTAVVQVTQARQPCWKLNARFQHDNMSSLVQKTMRTGWYYRVLEEGWIEAGNELVLIERSYPEWSLAKILNILYKRDLDPDVLLEVSQIKALTASWRTLFERRLETRQIENWDARLKGRSSSQGNDLK